MSGGTPIPIITQQLLLVRQSIALLILTGKAAYKNGSPLLKHPGNWQERLLQLRHLAVDNIYTFSAFCLPHSTASPRI